MLAGLEAMDVTGPEEDNTIRSCSVSFSLISVKTKYIKYVY